MQATALHLFAGGVHGGFIRGGVIMGVLGGVAVAGAAANALVAAGTKRPAAILFGRAIAGEQNRAHIRRAAGVIYCAVELVYGMRAKRIAHLRAVEGDAHDAVLAALAVEPVIGDIRQVLKTFYGMPQFRAERIIGAVFFLLAHDGQLSGKRRIVPIPNPHPHTAQQAGNNQYAILRGCCPAQYPCTPYQRGTPCHGETRTPRPLKR